MQAQQDKLTVESDAPQTAELAEDFFRCLNHGRMALRRAQNDDARYTRWVGQSDDGRKWDKNFGGERIKPWDGASDTRIPLADDIINNNVALMTMAFWRAIIKTMAVEVGDLEQSAWTNRLLEWLINARLFQTLLTEVELSAQYGQQYGWCVIHTGWERELSRRRVDVDLQQMVRLLAGDNPDSIASASELLTNPDLEAEAVKALKAIYFSFARSQVDKNSVDDEEIPELRDRQARNLLRALRESGAGNLVFPVQLKNQPAIYALKPWSEFFMPPETCDLQRAPRLYWLDYMTEVELKASRLEDGWNEEWIDAAIKLKGQSFTRFDKNWNLLREKPITSESGLIEVVHCYARQIDDDGVPGITYTVFHPGILKDTKGRPLAGKHTLLDNAHGKYPFAIYRRERPERQLICTRGVPDVAKFWQNELKKQRDALWDLTDLTTLPPISGPPTKGDPPRLGPAAYVPRAYDGDIAFMNLPQRVPGVAMELIKHIKDDAVDYFGQSRVDGPPDMVVMKRQMALNSFLGAWSEVLSQCIQNCQQYMSDDQMARLTGGQYAFPRDAATISAQFDTIMRISADELNTESVSKSLELISKYVIPMDVTGELDRSALTRMLSLSIGPDIYRALTADRTSGSAKTVDKVKTDLANILLGIEPDYIENDPQAPFKLRVLQQLTANNPTVTGLVQSNQHVQGLLEKYGKALTFSSEQQQNKTIGRIGVNPAPTMAMEAGQ